MKFCANCGQQLPDDAGFCPMCGTRANPAASNQDSGCRQPEEPVQPVQPDQPEEPAQPVQPDQPDTGYTPSYGNPEPRAPRAKISGKMLAGIISAVVAVAVVIAVVVTVFASGDYIALMPDSVNKLEACEKNMFRTVYDFSEEIADPDGIVSSTNALSFKKTDLIDDSTVEYILKQLEFDFEIALEKDGYLICLEPGFSGNTLTSVYLRRDKKSIGICVPDFEKKLFRINYDDLGEILDTDEELDLRAFDSKDIKKTLLDVVGIFCGIANEGNTEITKNVKLSIFGGDDTCKVSLYTIKPTGDDVYAVICRLIDYVENDKDSYLYQIVNAYCMRDGSLYDDVSEFFDCLRDEAVEISDFFDEHEITIEIAVKGKDIVMQRVITESAYEGEGGSAFGCFMRRKGKEIRIMAFEGYYDNSFDSVDDNLEYSSVCDIEATFSGKKLEGEGVVKNIDYNETYAELSFELDFGSRSPLGLYCGSLELHLIDEDITISLDVDKDGDTTEHDFKVVADGETFSFLIESTEGTDVSLPKNTKEVDLTSEEDIQDFVDEFVYDYLYGELIGQISGLLSGGFGFGW